jgi:hypothetical protein
MVRTEHGRLVGRNCRHRGFAPRLVSAGPYIDRGHETEVFAHPGAVTRLATIFGAFQIGETGFEPATARPPAGCATRLRHSPWSFDLRLTKERATGVERARRQSHARRAQRHRRPRDPEGAHRRRGRCPARVPARIARRLAGSLAPRRGSGRGVGARAGRVAFLRRIVAG